ncbi:MAG: helix-turn-helix domain-containing protein [Rikenellaceae bacterium]|nr:helix-turn-helix domain-containing protein [Rikenellaceae bacterium]
MSRERIEREFLRAVGKKLKEIRQGRNYTQEYVYERTKINLDRIENARSNFTLSTLHILCKFYGVPLEEFFKGL